MRQFGVRSELSLITTREVAFQVSERQVRKFGASVVCDFGDFMDELRRGVLHGKGGAVSHTEYDCTWPCGCVGTLHWWLVEVHCRSVLRDEG